SGCSPLNPNLYPNSPFDPVKDFAAVSLIATGPVAIVVQPALPAKKVKDSVALAKSSPEELNFGSPGIGSSTHLAGELFKIVAGVDLVHVRTRAMPKRSTSSSVVRSRSYLRACRRTILGAG